MKRCASLVGLLLIFGWPAPAPAAKEGAKDIVLADCLVIQPVGRYGRASLHLDALEAEIVAGRWQAPKSGDKVKSPLGGERTWEAATAKDGVLNHAALSGGYLYWKVEVEEAHPRILEASGHLLVYVNGEPRAGDPYQNGIVRLPVQ
ncbi:MAG TPA: hypothetical protein VGG61_04190, partial [Gemmataceae bacterium]